MSNSTNVSELKMVVSDLHTYYGDAHIIQGCSFEIGRECVGVLGRNGMGKTTLLRSIMGLTPPKSGSIKYGNTELIGKAPFEIAREGLGYVPQGRKLFPSLSVEEHLSLTYVRKDNPNHWTPQKVFEMFPEIDRRRKLSGTKMSGGEQQMLAIGRALVTNPSIILLDEPSEGLAPVANDRVIEICKELLKSGIAILLIEQNVHVAEAITERLYIFDKGQIVHQSQAGDFFDNKELRQKFLGI